MNVKTAKTAPNNITSKILLIPNLVFTYFNKILKEIYSLSFLETRTSRVSGPFITLIFILLTEFLRNTLLYIPNPAIFLDTAIVYSAFTGGLSSGFISVFMAWIYTAYFLSPPNHLFDFNLIDIHRLIVTLLTTTLTALMVGVLNWRSQLLTQEEIRFSKSEASRKRINKILESITDSFISLDRKGKITFLNKQAGKLFSRKRSELIGKNIWEEFPQLSKFTYYHRYGKIIKDRKALKFEEYISPLNGWFEIHTYPSADGLNIYLNNISERKKLEQDKDQFIDIASHELRTPVTTIRGYSQILEQRFRKIKDKQSISYILRMNESIIQLSQLVSDLLDTTRFSSGNFNFNKTLFKLDPLITEVIKTFQMEEKNHKITKYGKTTKKIFADKYRIRQVITNLISNALKYSPDQKAITVKVIENKTHVKVSVLDRGIGIPKEEQNKIFDRYYRASNRSSSGPGGVGLGLYICSEIIKAHKGEIGVRSIPSRGSTFFFTLPIQK